jgi:hypothetical protein
MEVIPDIKYNKMGWFDYFDEDNSGELSQAEVVRGLIKSFRCGQDLRQVFLLPPIRSLSHISSHIDMRHVVKLGI